MGVYQGARILDIYNAIRASKRSALRWPPMLRQALLLLAWLVAISSAIAGVDLWLHIDSSTTTLVPTSTDYASLGYTSGNTLFARTLNTSLCENFASPDHFGPNAWGGRTCGLYR